MNPDAAEELSKQLDPIPFGRKEKQVLIAILVLVIANLVVSILLVIGGFL